MRVAMIGSGSVGKALGGSLTKAGHEVTFTAAHPENAEAAAAELGATAATSNSHAVRDADVVVLAIPFAAGEEVAKEIAPVAGGKVVIDVSNPLKPDLSGTVTEPMSAAEVYQGWLPNSHVVKAFNTAFAARMAQPEADGTRLDGYVAGDDADAKAKAIAVIEAVGLEPVDVGPLSRARQLEALALLNIGLQIANGWNWTSGWKLIR